MWKLIRFALFLLLKLWFCFSWSALTWVRIWKPIFSQFSPKMETVGFGCENQTENRPTRVQTSEGSHGGSSHHMWWVCISVVVVYWVQQGYMVLVWVLVLKNIPVRYYLRQYQSYASTSLVWKPEVISRTYLPYISTNIKFIIASSFFGTSSFSGFPSSFFVFSFYFYFVSLFEVFVVVLFFFWALFFLSFFCLCVCVLSCVCGAMEEEDRNHTEKGGKGRRERATWGATGRGESLAVQPLQTNNGSRGLLPSPWALHYSKGLLFSPRFYFFFILFFFSFAFSFFSLFFCCFFLYHFSSGISCFFEFFSYSFSFCAFFSFQ